MLCCGVCVCLCVWEAMASSRANTKGKEEEGESIWCLC